MNQLPVIHREITAPGKVAMVAAVTAGVMGIGIHKLTKTDVTTTFVAVLILAAAISITKVVHMNTKSSALPVLPVNTPGFAIASPSLSQRITSSSLAVVLIFLTALGTTGVLELIDAFAEANSTW